MRLEAKTEKETYTPFGDAGLGRSTFEEFFDRYKTDNIYCVSEVRQCVLKFEYWSNKLILVDNLEAPNLEV